MVQLRAAYKECSAITKREAKNFGYAFLTLPPHKRRAIHVIYAFCRVCDDAVDQDIHQDKKLEALESLRERLNSAYKGHPQGEVFIALSDVAETFSIPHHYFQDLISGVEIDLTKRRYKTFEDLRDYCYRVASVVGLMCVEIFGYKDSQAKNYAVDLGIAMQLTNILRDIQEDLERDRIYIPQQEMGEYGYSEEELQAKIRNNAFYELMDFQANRARDYFHRGLNLLPYLSLRSRACPAVLAGIYSRILDRIEGSHFDVFNSRISLTRREKLLSMSTTWLGSMLPHLRVSPR